MSFKDLMGSRPFNVSYTGFILLISLYFGFVLNLPILMEFIKVTEGTSSGGFVFLLSVPLILSAVFNIVFQVFAFPYIVKPIMILLILTSSLASFATLNYGIIFDSEMIDNIFQTDISEASSYYSLKSLFVFLLSGLLPSIWIAFIKIRANDSIVKEFAFRLVSVLASVAVLLVVMFFLYKDYASIGRNHKYLNQLIVPNHAYTTYKYIKKNYFSEPIVYKQIGTDAKIVESKNGKPTLTVFILGETARSANISYNGYDRETAPYTRKYNVISFKETESCGTATAHSVPCMFSNMNRVDYNKRIAHNSDNFLNVLQHAGVSVLWRENDGGSKGVDKLIPSNTIDRNSVGKYCDGSVCLDGVMFDDLDQKIADMKGDSDEFVQSKPNGDKFIALHVMGSHGPTYWKRYPKDMELYSPSCNRADIENCSDDEIINTYDNTIVYTDYLIAKTIKTLKSYEDKYNVAMIYISDHGESLGENGIYLHGYPYALSPPEQRHVPFYLWMSDGFKDGKRINESCLREIADNETVSHDNLFHTVLGLQGVKSTAIDSNLDLAGRCKQ